MMEPSCWSTYTRPGSEPAPVATSGLPKMIVVSICENGSMLSFIKSRAKDGVTPGDRLQLSDKLVIAHDVAKGMAHLVEFGFVHRDLAARNILIDSLYVSRVADFGLSRAMAPSATDVDDEDNEEEQYYRSAKGQFPVRWTAPEAMETQRFTTQTDVWSYGVVLSELFSDGSRPYDGWDNLTVMTRVMRGIVMDRPPTCPQDIWDEIFLPCFAFDPTDRPSFAELVSRYDNSSIMDEVFEPGQIFGDGENAAGKAIAIDASVDFNASDASILSNGVDYSVGNDNYNKNYANYAAPAPKAPRGRMRRESSKYFGGNGWIEYDPASTSAPKARQQSVIEIEAMNKAAAKAAIDKITQEENDALYAKGDTIVWDNETHEKFKKAGKKAGTTSRKPSPPTVWTKPATKKQTTFNATTSSATYSQISAFSGEEKAKHSNIHHVAADVYKTVAMVGNPISRNAAAATVQTVAAEVADSEEESFGFGSDDDNSDNFSSDGEGYVDIDTR